MDWRSQIVVNKNKTALVLLSFLILYFLMAWLLIALVSPHPDIFSIDQLYDPNNQQIILVFFLCSVTFILCAMFFGGSLSVSGTHATLVTKGTKEYRQLYNVVEEMKIASSSRFMPKVYVLNVKYCNAFASGWSESNALIAVSKPLLALLDRDELQAVVAHEMSHIKHHDTRVMTLVMVCANLLVSLIDLLCRNILYGNRPSKKKESGGILILVILIVRLILPVLTAFLVMYVSRKREFLADAGCVGMTRNAKALASALSKIHSSHTLNMKKSKDAYKNTPNEGFRSLAYIYSPTQCGIFNLYDVNMWFSTHPSLEDRLKALGISRDML